LVDTLDSTFSVADLLQFKHHHEYDISVDLGVLGYPPVWIDSIVIDRFRPVFSHRMVLKLGRVNHLFGAAGLGKTAILEVLNSILSGTADPRWAEMEILSHIRLSTNERQNIVVRADLSRGNIRYLVGRAEVPLFPEGYFVVYLKKELRRNQDNVEAIRRCFNFPAGLLERLLGNGRFRGLTTAQYSLHTIRTRPYLTRELHLNVGNRFVQSFDMCSSSEQGRVLLDIGVAAASMAAKYRPVILLIDWKNISMFDDERFIPYVAHLFSSKALFQTIFVSPGPISKLPWTGWQKIQLVERDGRTAVQQ
jgi:hypothetical protein